MLQAIPLNSSSDTPPLTDAEVVPGDYRLCTGEPIKLFRKRPINPRAVALQQEIDQVGEQCKDLAKTLNLENEKVEELEVKRIIESLHEYNEVKDIAQALLGKLAMFECCTTKELYERYGLDLDD